MSSSVKPVTISVDHLCFFTTSADLLQCRVNSGNTFIELALLPSIQLYSIDLMPSVDLTTKGELYFRGRRRHFLRCERIGRVKRRKRKGGGAPS